MAATEEGERVVKIGLDADDVKDALRTHHPALGYMGQKRIPGQWVTLTEWCGIDLLALDCWQSGHVIGYEVKVSRSDLRSELLNPTKRMEAVSRCTEFYIATPPGLLTPDELVWVQPSDWTLNDFVRDPCTNPDCRADASPRGWAKKQPKPRGSKRRGTEKEGLTVHLGFGRDTGTHSDGSTYSIGYEISACCNVCKGFGQIGRSRVELEAPQLWIPPDVGLVEVDRRGVHLVKPSPKNKFPKTILGDEPDRERRFADGHARRQRQAISDLVRWTSFRPDPRHQRTYTDRIEP